MRTSSTLVPNRTKCRLDEQSTYKKDPLTYCHLELPSKGIKESFGSTSLYVHEILFTYLFNTTEILSSRKRLFLHNAYLVSWDYRLVYQKKEVNKTVSDGNIVIKNRVSIFNGH